MKRDEILKEVAVRVRRYLGSEYKLILFGSWARGDAREESDIDIGILGPDKVPWETYVRVSNDIEAIPTLRQIDIVDLHAVSERFRIQAIRDGITIE